jgi:hypothetical protein
LAAKSTQHPIFVPEDDQKLIVFDYCGPEGASCTNPQGGFGPLSITVPPREDACNFQIDSIIGRPLAKVGPNGSFYSEDSRSANGKPSGANMLISANNGGEGKCIIPPEASAELSCTLIDGAPGARVTVTNPDDDDTAVVDILKNGVVVYNDVSIPPLGTVTRDVPFDNMETATVSVEDTIGGAQQQLNATAEGDPIAQTEIFSQEFTANCLNPAVTVTKVCASGGLEVHLSNTDAIETATFVVTVNGTSTNHDVAGGGTEDFVIPVGENLTAHVVITQGGTTFVADDFTMDCFVPTVGIENVCSADTSGATFTFANAGESSVDLTVTKNGVVIDTVTVAPGTTVTKTYPMNEDETATYRVTGPAFDTGDQTLTHDCVHVEAAVVQAQELARTGPGDTKPLMMISGWFLMIGGLFLAVANKTLLRPATVRSNDSRGR